MKKKLRALFFFCTIAHALAMERPPQTLGDYIEKFETLSARVKHRIEFLPPEKNPTGLDRPYCIWAGEFFTRLFKDPSHEQSIRALTIKQFVTTKFKLACTLINTRPPTDPTDADIFLVTTALKKRLDHMLEQRETELTVYR